MARADAATWPALLKITDYSVLKKVVAAALRKIAQLNSITREEQKGDISLSLKGYL